MRLADGTTTTPAPPTGRDALRRSAPFVAVVLTALALEPLAKTPESAHVWLIAAASLSVAAIAVALLNRNGLVAWITWVPGLTVLVAVALLRHAGGGYTAGFGPLALLGPLWFGLYGSRRQLAVSLVGTAASFALPILLIGAPRYPSTSWRAATLFTLTAALAGGAIHHVRRELTARTNEMHRNETDLRDSLEGMLEPVARYEPIRDHGEITDLRCRFLNRAAERALGRHTYDILLSARLDEADRGYLMPVWLQVARTGEPARYEFDVDEPHRMGIFEVQLVRIRDDVLATWRDVTAVRREADEVRVAEAMWHGVAEAATDAAQRLEHDVRHDPLTGLLNRTGFLETLRHLLEVDDGAEVFLVYIDLDRFKPVNDSFGHEAGDVVLAEVAQRLRSSVRDTDAVARLGGDEFAIAGRARPTDGRVAQLLQRLDHGIGAPISFDDGALVTVGASMGVAHAAPGTSIDQLLGDADRSMYMTKRSRSARQRTVLTARDRASAG